jgi:4-amino-4-deoxy-L-arabinose transferase-like glycosyltransferase
MRAEGYPVSPWPAGSWTLVLLVAALVAVRLAAAGTIGLAPDEMYYWVWSRNLALSYFDHPPAVAYFIRLSTWLGGDGPFGVRWLAVLLSGLISLGVYRLAVRLYDDHRVGLAAAALLQATLFIGFGSIFVTPDTTLVLFWHLALLAAAELWRSGRGVWWAAIGAAVGLGFLSKYSALFLGFGLFVWIVVVLEMRRWLRSPWPYVGGVVGLLMTLPVLIWNARHDWASFAKQFGRAVPRAFDPSFVFEFIGAQALLLTPFVAVLAVYGIVRATRFGWRDPASGLLICTTLPLLVYFLYHALVARVEGNWTAPLLPALMVMGPVGLRFVPPAETRTGRLLAVSARWAVPTGVALSLLFLAHAEFRLVRLQRDPLAQTAGWQNLIRSTERLAEQHGAGSLAARATRSSARYAISGGADCRSLQLTERAR